MSDEPETPPDSSPGVCSRFYPALAVSMLVLAFLPLLEPVESEGAVTEYGTLFEIAERQGGGTATVGILLIAGLIALMVTASVWVPSRVLPLCIAGAAALTLLMLLTKVGSGTPAPDLTASGHAAVALVVVIIGVALVQVADLNRRRAGAVRAEH